MKERIISAIIALIIVLPAIFIGGNIFFIAAYLVGVIALKEFVNIKENKSPYPLLVKISVFIIYTIIMFINPLTNDLTLNLDFRVLAALFLIAFVPITIYYKTGKYNFDDSKFLITTTIFVGLAFKMITVLRNLSLNYFIYIILITIMSDTFAYLIGKRIGKHKLAEEISPNKSIEGLIAGTIMGTFIPAVFYITVINPAANIIIITLLSMFLSILGTLGDLVFSSIKRHYKIKDFGNIMPGHGGILDRLDSLIFVMFGFIFFISIL